jgi:hypothetical protein
MLAINSFPLLLKMLGEDERNMLTVNHLHQSALDGCNAISLLAETHAICWNKFQGSVHNQNNHGVLDRSARQT